MERASALDEFYANVRDVPEEEFVARVLRSVDEREVDGVRFPAFPSPELQLMFVGASGAAALEEAIVFYRTVKATLRHLGVPLGPDARVVDFGVGWGRIIRFFAHDVPPDRLIGVDPGESIVAEARRCELPAELRTIGTMPPLDLPAASVDLVYAFSVFSHLDRPTMDAWVAEFARVLRPGGTAIVTTRSRSFIADCERLRDGPVEPGSYADKLARAFDSALALEQYDAGQVVHSHLGAEVENYGETLLPVAYAATAWTKHLRVVQYLDDLMPGRNVAYIALQKPLA